METSPDTLAFSGTEGSRVKVPVSVVIPCFRSSMTVERAVLSVANQSVKPDELLLIDDASGDSTLDVLTELKERVGPDWITVVALRTNGGPSLARNAGWESSRNDHVAFLDADDAWASNKLQLQYSWMEKHEVATLTSHVRRLASDHRRAATVVPPCVWREVSPSRLLWRNVISTSTVMIRRDYPVRFPAHMRYSEDYWLWLHVAYGGGRIFFADTPLATTFVRPFGLRGLSAAMWNMECGELQNYQDLRARGRISLATQSAVSAWSLARYARRRVVSRLAERRRHEHGMR